VVVDIDEHDGEVRAVARLHDRASDRLVGEGVVHLGPVERVAPAVGAEIATARALHQLIERLVTEAEHEYDSAVQRAARAE
jgi:hypothetical protein